MAIVSFTPNTTIKSTDVNANFSGLSDGSLDATANSLRQSRTDMNLNYVVSGLTIPTSGNLSSTITTGTAYVGGYYVSVAANTHTYAASTDNYVDLDNTGTLHFTGVTNNTASPALTAGYIRIGIAVTDGTTIASVNQGSLAPTGPTVSSNILAVSDSLGNLIYPTTPTPGLIGYRQILASATVTSTTAGAITGLTLPVIIPAGRKTRIYFFTAQGITNGGANNATASICTGSAADANRIGVVNSSGGATVAAVSPIAYSTLTGSQTFVACMSSAAGTETVNAASFDPAFISVELV